LLAAPVVMAACVFGRSEEEKDEGAHTAGEFVWPQAAPPMWAAITRSAADAVLTKPTAPIGNPIEAHLDAWVKHFDGLVRARVQAETGDDSAAPKPYARVLVSPDPKVSGTRVFACVAGAPPDGTASSDAGVVDSGAAPELVGAPGDGGVLGPPDNSLAVLIGTRLTFSTNVASMTCLRAPTWAAGQGLTWFNGLGGLQVRDRGGSAVIADRDPSYVPISALRVAIKSAAPAIDVSAASVVGLQQTGMAIAIAREVARYHRAHDTTGVRDRFDFIYERTDEAGRPEPVADQADYRTQLAQVRLPRFLIAGQKYNARVAPTLLKWALSAEWDEGHPCRAARKYLLDESGAAKDELTLAGTEDAGTLLSSTARKAYLTWEPKMTACIAALDLTDAASTELRQPVPATSLKLPRHWFIEHLDPAMQEASRNQNLNAGTLRDLVVRLEALARGLDARAPDLEQKLRDNRIGIYTEAQEADEIALELATESGISPRRVLDAMFQMMALDEQRDPNAFAAANAQTTVADCKAWSDRGFSEKLADGTEHEIYVPSNLTAGRPSWCARVQNLFREARLHRYTPKAQSGPFDPNLWGNLQGQAAVLLGGQAQPPPVVPPPAPTSTGSATPSPDESNMPPDPSSGSPSKPKPTPAISPASEGADDGWEDDGWTAPPTKTKSSKNKAKATKDQGGCAIAASDRGVGGAVCYAVLLALALRRRRR
jgi:hypothetical protein